MRTLYSIKILALITILAMIVLPLTPTYGEWTKVAKNVKGDTYYVDFKKINKKNGYIFFWNLSDYLKLESCFESDLGIDKISETVSTKTYYKGDCKMFRYKILNYSWHKKPMGQGIGIFDNLPDKVWTYPKNNTPAGNILDSVCKYAKKLEFSINRLQAD